MFLYHFTHAPGLAGIRRDGFIRPSAADHTFAGGYVCLTSDPDRMGHGLPDGRPIPPALSTPLKTFNVNGVICCADHTEFRLTILFDQADPNLKSFEQLVPSKDRLGLSVSGYFPLGGDISDEELLIAVGAMSMNLIKDKSPTWWFYQGSLPMGLITAYEVLDATGKYVPIFR